MCCQNQGIDRCILTHNTPTVPVPVHAVIVANVDDEDLAMTVTAFTLLLRAANVVGVAEGTDTEAAVVADDAHVAEMFARPFCFFCKKRR